MSRKKGQSYTAEQKTKIVLELLKEESTAAQIAKKYGVTTQTLSQWKKKFLENASLAFEPAKVVQEFKEELKTKEAQIEELQNNSVNR
jgi:putative transposase